MTTENQQQTMREIIDIQNAWYQTHDLQDFINPTEDGPQGYEFGKHIWHRYGGIYSFQSLDGTYAALKQAGKLKRKNKPKKPEQKAAERAAAQEVAINASI